MTATRASGNPTGAGVFLVPSASRPGRIYNVIWTGPALCDCACRGFDFRGTCSHVRAVEALLETERRAALPKREYHAAALRRIGDEFDCGETA